MHREPEFIDEARLDQILSKLDATVGDQIFAGLVLKVFNLLGQITGKHPACPIFSATQAAPSGLLDLEKSAFPSDDSINPSIETDILNTSILIGPTSLARLDARVEPGRNTILSSRAARTRHSVIKSAHVEFPSLFHDLDLWAVFLFLFAFLLTVSQLSFTFGIWARKHWPQRTQSSPDFVPSTILELVALMLGFTFSMAITRADRRLDLVVREANAIGTTFLRSRLIALRCGRTWPPRCASRRDAVSFGANRIATFFPSA